MPQGELVCFLGHHIVKWGLQYPFRVYSTPLFSDKITRARELLVLAYLSLIISRERIDVLQFESVDCSHYAVYLSRILSRPYIIYAHGNEILALMHNPWKTHIEALMGADRVIANSDYTSRRLKDLGIEDDRIALVHPGCAPETFRPGLHTGSLRAKLGLANRKVLLTVGNLVKRKGHDKVIEALPYVLPSYPDVVYLIVGNGRDREYLEGLVSERRLTDKVFFVGYVPDSELPLYYNLCDIFLMPSRERLEKNDVEGFGIVCIEASSCSKPVIAGKGGGMISAVIDRETGYVVNPRDPGAIAASILELLNDPRQGDLMGRNGRKYVVDHLSNEDMAHKVREVLLSVA
jgi:phosphatidylinositol alpha-1,6-mannosyltransferase